MYKLFQSYVYRLSLPDCSVSVIEEILTKIRDLNSDEFKELKNLLSELFCKSIIIATKQNFISSLESSLIVIRSKIHESDIIGISLFFLFFKLPNKKKAPCCLIILSLSNFGLTMIIFEISNGSIFGSKKGLSSLIK